jgi:hypothetical protein
MIAVALSPQVTPDSLFFIPASLPEAVLVLSTEGVQIF